MEESTSFMKIGILFSLVIMMMVFTACGGGSDGGGGSSSNTDNSGITITGTVLAPNGQLAGAQSKGIPSWFTSLFFSEATAQATGSGLMPVARTMVRAIQIDANGRPSSPIATAQTDTNGTFSLRLPSGIGLSSRLIIQASGNASPSQVGLLNTHALNSPAVRNNIVLTPASELATRTILQRISTIEDFVKFDNAKVNVGCATNLWVNLTFLFFCPIIWMLY